MAYVIAEPCINVKDKACAEVCPVDCIHAADDGQSTRNRGSVDDENTCYHACLKTP
jgi:NAD-dependent dihydropyrimidine dehydrogenase PreA subunit